jgi:hypothetical protein
VNSRRVLWPTRRRRAFVDIDAAADFDTRASIVHKASATVAQPRIRCVVRVQAFAAVSTRATFTLVNIFLAHFRLPTRSTIALIRVQSVDTRAAILARIARTLINICAIVPEASSVISDVACACNLIVAQVVATRELGTLVFTSCTWVNCFGARLSSKSVATVTLERVDAVVTYRIRILACTRITTVNVQHTVIFVHFASRANETFDTNARHAANEVCALTLVEAPATKT